MSEKVLVIDNGGGYVRAGFNTAVKPQVKLPNCLIQSKKHSHNTTAGDDKLASFSATGYIVHRPVKAGILVEIDQQVEVWKAALEKLSLRDDLLPELGLALTEVYGTPPSVHQELEECCFEQFAFQSALFLQSEVMPYYSFPASLEDITLTPVVNPSLEEEEGGFRTYSFQWSPLRDRHTQKVSYTLYTTHHPAGSAVVLPPTRMCCNLGYSAISAFPMVHETIVDYAIYKNYQAGRFLDSQFKRAVCLRHGRFDFFDLALSRLRERCCVLSRDVKGDLRRGRIETREYQGDRQPVEDVEQKEKYRSLHVQETASLLGATGKVPSNLPDHVILGPERFGIYETLFNPGGALFDPPWSVNDTDSRISIVAEGWRPRPVHSSHADLKPVSAPKGIPALFVQAIQACPPIIQSAMCQNIVLGGGLVQIEGLVERCLLELRRDLPSEWPINVLVATEMAENTTWLGTAAWTHDHYKQMAVTKEEYLEGKHEHKPRL